MRKDLYTRPDKPLFMRVTRRRDPKPMEPREIAAPVMVDKFTECHVTPPDVAARMVDYAGGAGGKLTLEPSAGTGAILKALRDAGQSEYELAAVEQHHALAAQARKYCGHLMQRCFLEYAEEARGKVSYPRVIMNPPFRKVRQHIDAAISLMGRDGHDSPAELVALVPVTFKLEGAETLETLGPDTFSTAGVHTKIIYYEKP